MPFDFQNFLDENKFQNLEALQALLDKEVQQYNNAPQSDFMGLSPIQMKLLLNDPLGEGSDFGFRDCTDEDLDQIPFLRMCEQILTSSVLKQNPFKLTATSASLPVKTVKEVYDAGWYKTDSIESGITKLCKETDVSILHVAKLTLEIAGITRRAKGKWHLTKKGGKLVLPGQRNALFREIFIAFTQKYNWAYLDGLEHLPQTHGRTAYAYTLALLAHFGAVERETTFYARMLTRAFPIFLQSILPVSWSTIEHSFELCIRFRFFIDFAAWFGLVEITDMGSYLTNKGMSVRKMPVLERIFRLPELKGDVPEGI